MERRADLASKTDNEKNNFTVQNAVAHQRLEGLTVPPRAIRKASLALSGKLSFSTLIKNAVKRHQRNDG